jgi:hypothetical protein
MEQVIFYIDKATDEFKFSQIEKNKTEEELIAAIAKYNSQEDKKDRVYIVTDKHVVAAIIKKDSYDTIKSCAREVKKEISGMQRSIEDSLRDVERSVENMMEFIQDRIEDAPLNTAESPATDSQHLKAAIALVRQHANVLHEAGAYSLNSFLDVIEQRASV